MRATSSEFISTNFVSPTDVNYRLAAESDRVEAEYQVSLRQRFASSRIGKTIVGGLAAAGLIAGGAVVSANPAQAESSHTYTVTGTDGEGVWLHGDPGLGDTDDLIKIMPEGTRFEADCFVKDSPIGPRNNPIWLHGKDEAGATGYFTDFYSSSRWDRSNTLQDQGLSMCGEETKSDNSQKSEANEPDNDSKSVFFSPLNPSTGLRDIKEVADIHKSVNDWSSGDCSADKVWNGLPSNVDTFVTWSRGRMAASYALSTATDRQKDQLDNIILLDPGAESDMAKNWLNELRGRRTCDWRYNPSKLLAEWLKSDEQNKLTIIAGEDTEMKEDASDPDSHSTFAGLWKFYLADSRDKDFANQVTICDYNLMDHETIMREFAGMAKQRQMGCAAIDGYRLTKWHP